MQTVGILGAGSIGCFLGARLILAGVPTVLVGRPALADAVAANGLRITDFRGTDARIPAERCAIATAPAALADCDLVLLTVKSGATAQAAAELAPHLKPGACVISLQNGVTNVAALRHALPAARVLGGVVPYNVMRPSEAHAHRGTGGALLVEDGPGGAAAIALLRRAGLEAALHPDILAVQWGKMLLNLNNSINALANIPLREELLNHGFRQILAAAMDEARTVLQAAGIMPLPAEGPPPGILPTVLRLPTPLFRLIALRMLKIDAQARSSMWEDLQRGRPTEIDYLNGAVLRLAEQHGLQAPINAALSAAIREAEHAPQPPTWSAADLAHWTGVHA